MAGTQQSFGRYALLKRLARGGMAEIFEARVDGPAGFDKRVAVKRLHANLAEDDLFVSMLGDEARITARLSHPNICQVFDFGLEAGTYFIAMELIEGCDLGNLARRVKKLGLELPIPACVWIAREAAEGLAYAHALCDDSGRPFDVVHRDVSPQNILVSAHGEVKVCDFGIAKATARLANTQAGVLKGKFCYMAPEQARGEPLDGRADVFALGIVLFEMLAGSPLYPQTFTRETLDIVRRGAYPPLETACPGLPEGLEHALGRALAVSRVARPQARELADLLADVMRAEQWDFDRSRMAALVLAAMPELQKDAGGEEAGRTQLWPGSGKLGPVTDQELGTGDLEISSSATVAATPANLKEPSRPPSVRIAKTPAPARSPSPRPSPQRGEGAGPRSAPPAPRSAPPAPAAPRRVQGRRSVLDPRQRDEASAARGALPPEDEESLTAAPAMTTRMTADDVPAAAPVPRRPERRSNTWAILGVLVAGGVVGVVLAINLPLLIGGPAPAPAPAIAPPRTFVPLALPDASVAFPFDAGTSAAPVGRRGKKRGTAAVGSASPGQAEVEPPAEVAPPPAAGVPLTITAVPTGSAFVDGRRVGRTPVTTRVPPGRHNVVVEGPDGRSAQRTVYVNSAPERVFVNLE